MKLKKIGILLILLLLTGCTVNYELKIDDNGIFKETITGTVTNEELDTTGRTDENIYSYNLNSRTPLIRDQGTYKKNIIDKDGYKEFTFTYIFDNNYTNSTVINTCYENVTFSETEDIYYIDLNGQFDCMYSDKITVNIKSEYTVLENNADKIDGNTYIWKITSSDDADIHMAISKKNKEENKYIEKKGTKKFKTIGFITLIILSTITFFLYKKKNNNDA